MSVFTVHWINDTETKIVDCAQKSRRLAREAGHVYAIIEKLEEEGIDSLTKVPHPRIAMGWWSAGHVAVFVARQDDDLMVAEIGINRTPQEIEALRNNALAAAKKYLGI